MAVYEYVAKDAAGREFSGVYSEINNVEVLQDELAKIDCVLIKARHKKSLTPKKQKIKKSEIVTFAYKFAGMYSAGLPILSCLETMEEQTANPSFKYIIADVKHSVQTGSNLKEACARHGQLFSKFFLGMIEAGEASGKLGTTLHMSAQYLEKREEIKRKIISAFAYPVIVTVLCFAVIIFLLTFVMPTFAQMYSQAGLDLPGPTLVLIAFSSVIIHKWWILLIIIGIITACIKWLFKKPKVQLGWDSFKLNMPFFGKLNRLLAASHFTRTFAMLTSVGVPLIDAIELFGAVTQNRCFSEITADMKQMVKAGFTVTKTFKCFPIFPSLIVELAASGEQSGQLPDMLGKGADLLDKDIDTTINSYLTKLEPALTLTMGLIVGLILIGAYLPMFDYMGRITN